MRDLKALVSPSPHPSNTFSLKENPGMQGRLWETFCVIIVIILEDSLGCLGLTVRASQ